MRLQTNKKMGNAQVKKSLDARNCRIECGFYIRSDVFDPIYLEWDQSQGRGHKYKWTSRGGKKGELVYQSRTPKSAVFVDVLHALGFDDATENDVRRGTIQTKGREDRSMLAYIRYPDDEMHSPTQPEFYIDDGMLRPVRLSRIRNLFPDPNNSKNVTFHGSGVYFNNAKTGIIVYRPDTPARDLFKLALGKIGKYDVSAGHFSSGFITINDWHQPILTFRVPCKR